jgi:hypothetical protein
MPRYYFNVHREEGAVSWSNLFRRTHPAVSFPGREKRQDEISRQMFCSEKAGKEKVMKRNLASFVIGCMEAIERAEQALGAKGAK